MSLTEEECSICLEKLKKEIAHTTCNHFFHYRCIGEWIDKNKSNPVYCPICLQLFEIKNIYLSEEIAISSKLEEIVKPKTRNCCIL